MLSRNENIAQPQTSSKYTTHNLLRIYHEQLDVTVTPRLHLDCQTSSPTRTRNPTQVAHLQSALVESQQQSGSEGDVVQGGVGADARAQRALAMADQRSRGHRRARCDANAELAKADGEPKMVWVVLGGAYDVKGGDAVKPRDARLLRARRRGATENVENSTNPRQLMITQ